MSYKEKHIDDFIWSIKYYINFWEKQDVSSKEKLEGLAHSILCMLDGVCGSFQGDITSLENSSKCTMLHDQLYKKDL